MSTPFEFEEEGDHEFQETEFQETEFQETEWEAEYGSRRARPRMARRLPAGPLRPVKRPLAFRPRLPGRVPYRPIFPVIPWTAQPLDQPPVSPSNGRPPSRGAASPPVAEPPADAAWPADAPAQDAASDSP